ncbi:MAG: hypothetical protein SF182_27030 [Deltaproteobacteria bacterium]|nr:hypothetical protein [Deltaproteobacteria bacterium]
MDVLVTCIYNDLYGTPYGGRQNRAAHYRDSLATIAGTGLPIHCFVPAADLDDQRAHFATCPGQIAFTPLELHEIPLHARVRQLKSQYPERYGDLAWQERCVEIMWGKFFMLERVLAAAPQAERLYWIDAGLANANIISTKYIADDDLRAQRLSAVRAAFPPRLFTRIAEFAGDKLLLLRSTTPHHQGIPAVYNARPYADANGVVAGLFGGRRAAVADLCAAFRAKLEALLADDLLYFEESIMAGIYADDPDRFATFTFDTWFHEGWHCFDPSLINFSNFFDRMLETPPGARREFPWNT